MKYWETKDRISKDKEEKSKLGLPVASEWRVSTNILNFNHYNLINMQWFPNRFQKC